MKKTFLSLVWLPMILVVNRSLAQQPVSVKVDTLSISNDYFEIFRRITIKIDSNSYVQKYLESYFKSGQLRYRTEFDLEGYPTGLYESYYNNGQINETYLTIKGRPVGLYQNYFENGKIKMVGIYKDVLCYSDVQYREDTVTKETEEGDQITTLIRKTNTVKVGKWLIYNQSGTLERVDNYGEKGEYEDW